MTDLRSAKATRPASARAPHVPSLDGLRGVAIAGVLLFHTGHLPGGFLGVDLFFVLSGYLITDLLLREVEATGRVSLTAFWGRRIRRLVPALAAMLIVVAAMVWALGPPDLVRTTLSDFPWVPVNLLNWHLIAESVGYWDRFGSKRVFEHLWSIAVEEQFYLVWPVLVLLAARFGRRPARATAAMAVLISMVSVALTIALVDQADPTRVYFGTDTRASSLLLGAVAAVPAMRGALVRATGRWSGAAMALAAVGIGAIWALADGIDSPWLFNGGLLAHSILCAILIGLCASRPRTGVTRALAWRPLQWLGRVSYSLYLWHRPVIVVLSPQVTGFDGWQWTVFVCAVSTALAVLSKYLVEDPIRFRARWARGRRGALAFTALMIVLTAMWLVLPEPAPPQIDVTNIR